MAVSPDMMCSFGFGDSVSLGDDVLGGDAGPVACPGLWTRAGSSVSGVDGNGTEGISGVVGILVGGGRAW